MIASLSSTGINIGVWSASPQTHRSSSTSPAAQDNIRIPHSITTHPFLRNYHPSLEHHHYHSFNSVTTPQWHDCSTAIGIGIIKKLFDVAASMPLTALTHTHTHTLTSTHVLKSFRTHSHTHSHTHMHSHTGEQRMDETLILAHSDTSHSPSRYALAV